MSPCRFLLTWWNPGNRTGCLWPRAPEGRKPGEDCPFSVSTPAVAACQLGAGCNSLGMDFVHNLSLAPCLESRVKNYGVRAGRCSDQSHGPSRGIYTPTYLGRSSRPTGPALTACTSHFSLFQEALVPTWLSSEILLGDLKNSFELGPYLEKSCFNLLGI